MSAVLEDLGMTGQRRESKARRDILLYLNRRDSQRELHEQENGGTATRGYDTHSQGACSVGAES